MSGADYRKYSTDELRSWLKPGSVAGKNLAAIGALHKVKAEIQRRVEDEEYINLLLERLSSSQSHYKVMAQ